MTPLRKNLLAIVGSALFHVGPMLPTSCGFGLDIPLPEFELEVTEMEFIDPEQQLDPGKQEKPPEPEVIPPPMGPELPPEGEGPKPEDKPPEPPKPKVFGEKASKVDQLGPTGSNFYALLNAKKVAPLKFAESVVEIMAPLPDFQFIIEGGGFHALRDFNYIVIASPDIRVVTQTFLAVEYKLPQAEIQAGLERAAAGRNEKIEWVVKDGRTMGNPVPLDNPEKDHDPRWFVFLDDKVAVYVREEFLPSITVGPDEAKGKTAGNFIANLAKLKTFAAREPRAGLQLVLKDILASVKVKNFPIELPNGVELMAEAAAEPELVIKFEFVDAVAAKRFEKQWTDDLPRFIDEKVPFVARGIVRGFYNATTFAIDGKQVTLRCPFAEDQATLILDQIAAGARKMLKKTPEEIEADKKRRDELWQLRKNGKLTPSEALEKLHGKGPEKPKPDGKLDEQPADPPPPPTEPPPVDPDPPPT